LDLVLDLDLDLDLEAEVEVEMEMEMEMDVGAPWAMERESGPQRRRRRYWHRVAAWARTAL
jgi:hypothetical protein